MPRPGEITLAHRGVLFLDELPEFARRALESLREPLEHGEIHIARAAMHLVFPARFLLVAAMNPCPCGRYKGDGVSPSVSGEKPCVCSFAQVQRYRNRISGPLLDRIDLHVAVDAVPYRDYAREGSGERTVDMRRRISAAHELQRVRLGPGRNNASLSDRELRSCVTLDETKLAIIEAAIDTHGLSTRAISRVLKVARTIADLASSTVVRPMHLEEALSYRLLDRGRDLFNDEDEDAA